MQVKKELDYISVPQQEHGYKQQAPMAAHAPTQPTNGHAQAQYSNGAAPVHDQNATQYHNGAAPQQQYIEQPPAFTHAQQPTQEHVYKQ
jgi:hypothetical protein